MPSAIEITPRSMVLAIILACVWFWFSWTPLPTTVWGHVRAGERICTQRIIPVGDPDQILAEGMPAVADEWLAQVAIYLAHKVGGNLGLVALHAILVGLLFTFASVIAYRESKRLWVGVAAILGIGMLSFSALVSLQPLSFTPLLFSLVVYFVTRPHWRPIFWLAVPLLVALWANTHASFPIALLLLGARAIGSVLEACAQEKRASALWESPAARHAVLLFEVVVAASFVNPATYHLHVWVVSLLDNSTIREWIEFQRLPPDAWESIAFYVSVIAVVVLLRYSPRPVNWGDGVSLAVFGVLAMLLPRGALWWSILLPYFAAPHVVAITSQEHSALVSTEPRNFKFTGFALAAWGALFFLSGPMLSRFQKTTAQHRMLAAETPRGAVAYLKKNRPAGMVYVSQNWAPWLLWAGPPNVRVFATNRAELLPAQVWTDFTRISQFRRGFEFLLDRYGVNTLVIDLRTQADLLAWARQTRPSWNIVYDDAFSVVAKRPAGAVSLEAESGPAPAAGEHSADDGHGHPPGVAHGSPKLQKSAGNSADTPRPTEPPPSPSQSGTQPSTTPSALPATAKPTGDSKSVAPPAKPAPTDKTKGSST